MSLFFVCIATKTSSLLPGQIVSELFILTKQCLSPTALFFRFYSSCYGIFCSFSPNIHAIPAGTFLCPEANLSFAESQRQMR
jgi:hypothetical protein